MTAAFLHPLVFLTLIDLEIKKIKTTTNPITTEIPSFASEMHKSYKIKFLDFCTVTVLFYFY